MAVNKSDLNKPVRAGGREGTLVGVSSDGKTAFVFFQRNHKEKWQPHTEQFAAEAVELWGRNDRLSVGAAGGDWHKHSTK